MLKRFTATDAWPDIIEAIDADGGVIVEEFLSADLHSLLVEQLQQHADGFAPGIEDQTLKKLFWGDNTKRFSGLAARAPAFAEVIDHDMLHAWCESGFANDYWLNTGQAMIVGPGSAAQMLHRDAGNWPIAVSMGVTGPEVTLSAMLALSDFTAENGATQVVPGSHKWSDFSREALPEETVQAVMPARSALLYTGKTIHGAGANSSTDQWRFGVHISFVLAQLTPEEAHPVAVPWDEAQHFSERVKHMLGYASHRTFLPDWAVLWTNDYRDVRDGLEPPREEVYVSSGEKHLKRVSPS